MLSTSKHEPFGLLFLGVCLFLLGFSLVHSRKDIGHRASGRRQEASEVMVGAWEVGIAPAAPFGFMRSEVRWLSILYQENRNLWLSVSV